ncbi:MAG: hypothetical protein A2086_16100 [Spirochaetes bacterium GWD1_27_9]|nr:MAG: hypothetical protein A2Z98_11725 [Spirochaetes bacterium GWB1_27_13]OHD22613.1 MAG: hypothetical protein A2Y34_07550 [Spirochaetes bacterium GWC1_27_15]OHD37317.1 MAG: hypothetical protein A2086_16100 [Spirochaetes bacterium GWD1_27_9]
MNISIIIPTLNRLVDLQKFISSLEEQTYLANELIIVDQSDNDLTKEFITNYSNLQKKINVKYLYSPEKSLTKARNFGIKHIGESCDLVAFFDDDVILNSDYLSEIINFFENDKQMVYKAATGYIQRKKWKSKISFLFKLFFLQEEKDGKFKINGLPTYPENKSKIYSVEFFSGCNMIFRKEIFNEFSFDNRLKKYCYMEDADFSFRLTRKYKGVFIPTAICIHNQSTINRLKFKELTSFFIQNYVYLFKKNIKKTPANIFAFIWSIFGLIFISLLTFKFRKVAGYFSGLLKVFLKREDSFDR